MPDKIVAEEAPKVFTESEIQGEALASLRRLSEAIQTELGIVTDKPGSEAAGRWKSALQVAQRLVADEMKAQGG